MSSSEIDAEEDIYFGKIISYDETSGIITYVKSSAEEIEESMDLYIQPVLKGEDLLSESARQEIERKVLSQITESGFATQAGFVLAELAENTDSFRNMEGVQVLFSDENGNELSDDEIELLNIGKSFELKDGVDLKVEIVTSGEQLHYQDKGSVQLNVGIDADFEVETDDGGKVIIDLSASFTQELAIGITASGELVKKEILFIPVPVGVRIGSVIDLLSYTGVSMSVHAYTVAEEDEPIWEQLKSVAENPEKLADVLPESDRFAEVKKGLETVGDVFDKIDELGEKIEQVRDNAEKAIEYTEDLATLWEMVGEMEIDGLPDEEQWKEMGEALGKTNISEDLADMLDISSETELNAGEWERGLEGLLTQYGEMLENETDWVKLVQEEMCRAEVNICGLVIYVKADFVVRADMNIVMGADLSYQVGRRYNFWVKVGLFKPSAGSSTMDLTDEEFALRFYVMGKLGIKMAVEATAGFAIGSADVARVGVRLEIGPYVKIYGFFIYEYEHSREANTSEWKSEEHMAGALYLDFGLYLILGVDASALGDLFEVSYDFVDEEFPLLEAGNKKYPYAFLYETEDDEKVVIRDEDGDSTNGITASLSEECITLKCCNLDSGILGTVVYGIDSYNFTFSNPKFKMDGDGVITVDVPDGVRYLECEMSVTYKYGKLAFSKYDMQLTVPLVWTNLSSDEIGEYYTASVRVGNESDGYETVWSKRVVKNQEFTLPTEEEIKELIGYDSAKYSNFECFNAAGTTTSIIENTSFDCNVEYTPYSVTVDNIYNADGTCESRIFTTRYGEAFDFTSLLDTGINIPNDDPTVAKFTKFSKVVTNSTVTVGTDKDGNAITEVIDLTQPVTKKTAAAIADGNVVATAEYTDDSVLVTYTFTGAQIPEYSERIRKGTLSSYDFNKCVAWYGMMVKNISPDITPVYSAVTYNVECTDIVGEKYTISFNENGGSSVSETERVAGSLIGTLPTSEREGYTFKGWYYDEMPSVRFNERFMPEEDVHLRAKWEANTYKITFNVNGGDAWTDENNGTKTVTYDGTYQDLPLPSRSGYGFVGYFTAREGGTQVTCDTKVTVTQDTTLYARWKLLKTIPKSVFDFGDAEKVTYSKGVSHEVLYSFAAEEGESYGLSDFTLKYMRQGNSEYEEGLPVNAGTYDVVVSRPADNEYAKFEQIYTAVITVDKATRSPEAFANADLLTSSLKSGLNYIEMRLDPDSIDDFDAENTKVVFTASNIQGNIVILSEGGKAQETVANKNARIINLLPDTEYALTFTVTGDPNYYDYTHTKYLSTTVRTIKNDTSEFWTDHAEAFTVNEETKTVMIENEAQLAYLAKAVNVSGSETAYKGYTFILSRDMYLLDYAWEPIGLGSSFGGTFDGNGHTVYGLHTSANERTSGLFATVYYGEIKNLTISESYICGSAKVGAIVGWIRGSVTNCVNNSTVVGRCSHKYDGGTGGIAGESEGYSELRISGCVNNGRVDGVCQTGGIVGALNDNIAVNNVNNGTVKGTDNHTGGIVGYVDNANVMNSVNNGSVTGVNCVGGVVGQNEEKGYVLNCYTTGTVKGTGVYIGAVVGRNYKKCTVHQCYYLYNSASCNGSYRNAVGTEKGSLEDGKDGTSTAYFTSATSSLSRNADCGNANLLSALNNWVEWWNDYNCNAVWTAGEDGYPLPNGNINTKTGTKQ